MYVCQCSVTDPVAALGRQALPYLFYFSYYLRKIILSMIGVLQPDVFQLAQISKTNPDTFYAGRVVGGQHFKIKSLYHKMGEGLIVIQSIFFLQRQHLCHALTRVSSEKISFDGNPTFPLTIQLEESLSFLIGRPLILLFFRGNLIFHLCRFKPHHAVFCSLQVWRTCRIARNALVV